MILLNGLSNFHYPPFPPILLFSRKTDHKSKTIISQIVHFCVRMNQVSWIPYNTYHFIAMKRDLLWFLKWIVGFRDPNWLIIIYMTMAKKTQQGLPKYVVRTQITSCVYTCDIFNISSKQVVSTTRERLKCHHIILHLGIKETYFTWQFIFSYFCT